jgi:cyclopropane-fatty-acyl-phospholipid synthase
LFTPPHAGLHAAAARAIVHRAVRRLRLRLAFPDGSSWGAGGPDAPTLHLARPDAFFARLGKDGLIGLGEAWMTGDLTAGDWRVAGSTRRAPEPTGTLDPAVLDTATDALADVLTALAGRLTRLVPKPLQALRRLWQRHQPATERNTVTGARQNIHRHYDLSNDMFALFLDESMTYSAAWFEPADGNDLHAAQLRKIDGMLDLARVGPGCRLVEIGSGWGALAIRAAAERKATVTTLTLSVEQRELALRRIAEAGLSDRIEVLLQDYRVHAAGHRQSYDAAVSVEMIEAVGRQFWKDYFSSVQAMLRPGSRFGLQAITVDHARLLATSGSYTWIHKYVFPGGELTSLPGIEQVLAQHTRMRVLESRSLGNSYARTLRLWRHRFNAAAERAAALGFDETFRRMWNFYLAYSEAGFASGYLDDWQLGIG